MENIANHIHICGELQSLPCFSHENRGISFYRFELRVDRLSGTPDILPVIASQRLLDAIDLSGGGMLNVTGEIRSYNAHVDGARRLLVFVFAAAIVSCEEPAQNEVSLTGTICKPPIFRQTPLGREICDMMLAVSRLYHRSDYLPCILWGRTARTLSGCQVGDRVTITGRLQSRDYVKQTTEGPLERRTYEISALTAHPAPPLEAEEALL